MTLLQWLLSYPYIWQSILSFLFTLGLVWVLVWFLGLKDAGLRVWIFTLPILIPLLLPFKGQIGLFHWLLLLTSEKKMLLNLHGSFSLLTMLCILPPFLFMVRSIFSYLAYRRLLWNAREVTSEDEPQLFSILTSLVQKAGVPLPQVYILPSGRIQAFVCGTLRPRLILSPVILEALPEAELKAVLAHEVAHLARYDQVFLWLINLLSSLMFYNPLIYPLVKWLGNEREKAADAYAANLTGQPQVLARSLLYVMKLELESRCGFPSLSLPIAELTNGNAVYERVKVLLTDNRQQIHGMFVQAWIFGLAFLGLEGLFTISVLLPFIKQMHCVMVLL